MNQRTNKSVLLKRFRGWLALIMAVTMLFGSSMTVFAAEYTYNASNVGEITTSTKYYGGDTICYEGSGSIEILVYVNDEEMDFQYENGYYVATLSGDASVVYTVSEIYIDGDSTSLKMQADIPKTKYLYHDYESPSVKGISVGDTLSAGDSVKCMANNIGSGAFEELTLIIDGGSVAESEWTTDKYNMEKTYTFDKDVTVTGVECDDEFRATITFSTGANSNASSGSSSTDSGNASQENKPQEPKENEEQIFTRELLEQAAGAKSGDSMVIDATLWHSFNANVLKELLSKEGVSYTFYYNYGGECFYITIPAGAVLEEGCEWYGPLKLNAMFGRTMIDKKDLHAAINK